MGWGDWDESDLWTGWAMKMIERSCWRCSISDCWSTVWWLCRCRLKVSTETLKFKKIKSKLKLRCESSTTFTEQFKLTHLNKLLNHRSTSCETYCNSFSSPEKLRRQVKSSTSCQVTWVLQIWMRNERRETCDTCPVRTSVSLPYRAASRHWHTERKTTFFYVEHFYFIYAQVINHAQTRPIYSKKSIKLMRGFSGRHCVRCDEWRCPE